MRLHKVLRCLRMMNMGAKEYGKNIAETKHGDALKSSASVPVLAHQTNGTTIGKAAGLALDIFARTVPPREGEPLRRRVERAKTMHSLEVDRDKGETLQRSAAATVLAIGPLYPARFPLASADSTSRAPLRKFWPGHFCAGWMDGIYGGYGWRGGCGVGSPHRVQR